MPERVGSTLRRAGRPAPDAGVPDESVVLLRGLEAFAELGYDRASARELARRLGVSHNFINDRYGSKSKFWYAVVDWALDTHQRDRLPLLRADLDPEQHLRAVIGHFYRRTVDTPLLGRLLADEFSRESERVDYLYERYIKPELDALAPSLERLVAAKRMAPVSRDVFFFAVIGPASALVQNPLAHRLGRPETETHRDLVHTAEQLATLIVDGLLAAGGPAGDLAGD